MRKQMISNFLLRGEENILSFPAYDSFGTVIRLRPYLYGILTRSPLYSGDAWVYLLLGNEKALVIDTGFGIGDLKSVLLSLAEGRPLMVINTHFHIDHALGNSQFEEIWISKWDEHLLYPMSFTEYSNWSNRPVVDHSFYAEEDVLPYKKPVIHTFDHGFRFDIGGCELEAFHVPGHTCGGMCFLDYRDRILFTGDAVMYPFPAPLAFPQPAGLKYPELTTVTAFRNGLATLLPHLEDFDVICDGHGLPLSPNFLIQDMYNCAKDITDDPDKGYQEVKTYRGEARTKHWGFAAINYSPDRV